MPGPVSGGQDQLPQPGSNRPFLDSVQHRTGLHLRRQRHPGPYRRRDPVGPVARARRQCKPRVAHQRQRTAGRDGSLERREVRQVQRPLESFGRPRSGDSVPAVRCFRRDNVCGLRAGLARQLRVTPARRQPLLGRRERTWRADRSHRALRGTGTQRAPRAERSVGRDRPFRAPEPRLFAGRKRNAVSDRPVPARRRGVGRPCHTGERESGEGLRARRRVPEPAMVRLPFRGSIPGSAPSDTTCRWVTTHRSTFRGDAYSRHRPRT